MFVYNMRIKPSKKLILVFAVASAVIAVICIACMVSAQSKMPETATCDELGEYSLCAETAEEQCSFLEQFGLNPDFGGRQVTEITIPNNFNTVYNEYNSLQKTIGFDLGKYKGKIVDMVTYPLKNSDEKAVLLVYRGTVIGGHITNGEYGVENKPLI